MIIRSLLTCLSYRVDDGLYSLDHVFSRLAHPILTFGIYMELEKAPFASGIGVDLRLTRRSEEVWRLGEELIELVPGEGLVAFAAQPELDEPLHGASTLECLIDGRVLATRMLYFGSRRKSM